jgi:hypothetical protein
VPGTSPEICPSPLTDAPVTVTVTVFEAVSSPSDTVTLATYVPATV